MHCLNMPKKNPHSDLFVWLLSEAPIIYDHTTPTPEAIANTLFDKHPFKVVILFTGKFMKLLWSNGTNPNTTTNSIPKQQL